MKVTKRSGTKEDFNVEKIKQVIEWACDGLDVQPLALESKFDEFIFDGIATSQLQLNLIEHAKSLCSPQQPDWTFVAGRLQTMQRWANTRTYDISFLEFVREQQKLGIYTHPGINEYTDEQVEYFGSKIVQERDLAHSYASVVTGESKYLLENECIQQMFMVEAMIIASVEETIEDRMFYAERWYNRLSEREISLATPWLGNLRSNGNISSCFIISMNDTLESIFDNVKNAAMISKFGGGLGVYLGKLRAKGSSLMGNEGAATGILGWSKILNDTAVYVNQAGKRKGAFTLALPIWHGDVEDFLELQTEAGDQRKKAYDVKPQLCVPDYFMELKEDEKADWYTFCPHEVKEKTGIALYEIYGDEFKDAYDSCVKFYQVGVLKVVSQYKAKELWKKVMKVQFETGMPYIAFTCAINRHNPNKHISYIPCVNLCTESFSAVIADEIGHTCNLASVVVGRVALDKLAEVAADTLHILDNGIVLTQSPVDISKAHNDLLATVGVGIQGLHDIIAREGKSFYDEAFIDFVGEEIAYGCVKKSIELAKKRGCYTAFDGSEWENGNKFEHYKKYSKNPERWEELQNECNKYGVRNSQMTSPAPNTSTSIFMDAGAGVMPVYSAFFYEDNKDGVMPVVSMFLKENPLSYARSVEKHDPWELTKMTGWLQRWVDTGISAEYIMNKNREGFSAKWLWDTLNEAWKNNNKAVYYIRTIKKGEGLVKDNDVCVGCAG